MSSLETFFFDIPPVTRLLISLTFGTTLGVVFRLFPVEYIYFDWILITKRLQIWRLFTGFFFIGPFSIGWLFHIYFLTLYSSKLEKHPAFSPPLADRGSFLHFILLEMLFLDSLVLLLNTLYSPLALGLSLNFAIVYYWSKIEAFQPVSVWGYVVKAWQLPYVLLLLNLLMGQPILHDIVGLLAGHVYFFFRDVSPAENNIDLLSYTPPFLGSFVDLLDFSSNNRNSTESNARHSVSPGFHRNRQSGISTLYSSSTYSNTRNTHRFPGPGYRVRDGAMDDDRT